MPVIREKMREVSFIAPMMGAAAILRYTDIDLKKQMGTPVIVANSLMRRRDDIDLAAFQQHWLDPHGPLTAKLPGCRHYVQNHILDSAGTNALARSLRIDGIPQLAFASPEDRMTAQGPHRPRRPHQERSMT